MLPTEGYVCLPTFFPPVASSWSLIIKYITHEQKMGTRLTRRSRTTLKLTASCTPTHTYRMPAPCSPPCHRSLGSTVLCSGSHADSDCITWQVMWLFVRVYILHNTYTATINILHNGAGKWLFVRAYITQIQMSILHYVLRGRWGGCMYAYVTHIDLCSTCLDSCITCKYLRNTHRYKLTWHRYRLTKRIHGFTKHMHTYVTYV